jgi:hypothetical protein
VQKTGVILEEQAAGRHRATLAGPPNLSREDESMATLTTNVEAVIKTMDTKPQEELAQRIEQQVAGATTLAVRNAEDLELARAKVKALRVLRNGPTQDHSSVRETFEPITRKADELHKMVVAARDLHYGRIDAAIRHYTEQADAWIRERNRIEAEEQARVIRERQEAEQKERARLEAEAKAKRDVDERERRKAAELAEKFGAVDIAAELRQPASAELPKIDESKLIPFHAPVLVQSAVPPGLQRKRYTFVVDDPTKIPAAYLLPPDAKQLDPASYPRIRAAVQATGLATSIPGVRVIEDTKTVLR